MSVTDEEIQQLAAAMRLVKRQNAYTRSIYKDCVAALADPHDTACRESCETAWRKLCDVSDTTTVQAREPKRRGAAPRSDKAATKMVGVRVTEAEMAALKERAGKAPVSEWLRALGLGQPMWRLWPAEPPSEHDHYLVAHRASDGHIDVWTARFDTNGWHGVATILHNVLAWMPIPTFSLNETS